MRPPETLKIRRAVASDAEALTRVNTDPDVMRNLLQVPFGNVDAMRARLAEQNVGGKSDLQLVAEVDGELVGSAGLHPASLQLRRRHVMGLGIGLSAAGQGRGVGTALMQALLDYADQWAQVQRIELTVFADNARAIRLYERFGFRVEGTHRAYALRDGVFADVLAMARLHPKPPVAAWPDA